VYQKEGTCVKKWVGVNCNDRITKLILPIAACYPVNAIFHKIIKKSKVVPKKALSLAL
jgi:hypothetical protein